MSTPVSALKQGTFDVVVLHASGMNNQSREADTGLCMYRDGKGGSCFAGALMSDDHIAALPSGTMSVDVHELHQRKALPEHMLPVISFIRQLQRIHDCPSHWHDDGKGPPNRPVMAAALRALAEQHGLKTVLVDTHFAS